MPEHTLLITSIEDEGEVTFAIDCPSAEGERCPALVGDEEYYGCLVEDELQNIGREIIRGKAEGHGPWPIKLVYEGSGEDAEGWIELLPNPA